MWQNSCGGYLKGSYFSSSTSTLSSIISSAGTFSSYYYYIYGDTSGLEFTHVCFVQHRPSMRTHALTIQAEPRRATSVHACTIGNQAERRISTTNITSTPTTATAAAASSTTTKSPASCLPYLRTSAPSWHWLHSCRPRSKAKSFVKKSVVSPKIYFVQVDRKREKNSYGVFFVWRPQASSLTMDSYYGL